MAQNKSKTSYLYICIGILLILTPVVGKIILSQKLTSDIRLLFSEQPITPGKTFQYSQLTGLPKPVERYFKHVLKEGQPYVCAARLRHGGYFKTAPDNDWIDIEGEEYFTTTRPGYIWNGTTSLFTARDKYLSDKGRLVVFVLSLFKVEDASGQKYDEGELLRWLGESVCFPTNLLPSEYLRWSPVNGNTAVLNFHYKGIQLCYVVYLIKRMRSYGCRPCVIWAKAEERNGSQN